MHTGAGRAGAKGVFPGFTGRRAGADSGGSMSQGAVRLLLAGRFRGVPEGPAFRHSTLFRSEGYSGAGGPAGEQALQEGGFSGRGITLSGLGCRFLQAEGWR